MSPSSPAAASSLELLQPGVVLEQVARPSAPGPRRAPPPPRARPRHAACASGFSTKQCLPAPARARPARRGSGTGVATTTASSAGSARSSSRSAVARAGGKRRRQRARASGGAVADPGQLGVRQPLEVSRQVRAPVAEPDDPDPNGRPRSQAHQVRRLDPARDATEVHHERRLRDHALDVEAGVRGHDHRAVRALRARLASGSGQVELGQLRHVSSW